jgi:hypothetical protein
MSRIAAYVLALTLIVCGALPAAAACYGPGQIRQMVGQGQVIPLSSVLPQINAVGQPVSVPRLCDNGGGLAYEVDVMHGGSVVHVRVDAHSGAVSR